MAIIERRHECHTRKFNIRDNPYIPTSSRKTFHCADHWIVANSCRRVYNQAPTSKRDVKVKAEDARRASQGRENVRLVPDDIGNYPF